MSLKLMSHEGKEAEEHLQGVRAAMEALPQDSPKLFANHWCGTFEDELPTDHKVIHWIRHGQGHHNVHGEEWSKNGREGNAYSDISCPRDALLTEIGKRQAGEARQTLGRLLAGVPADDVSHYVSPLRRTVETAMLASPGAPWVANELLHEHGGLHRCDWRLPLSQLQSDYPDVVFDDIDCEEDPFWHHTERETYESLLNRCHEFLHQVAFRCPTSHIVVVSHSAFLFGVFQALLEFEEEERHLKGWMKTAEVRSVQIRKGLI